jgi:CRISPR/Cas system type I-B associated protein Csh2 (Cas7 group RAMP superfamily)
MSDIKVSSAYPTNIPMDPAAPVTPHHQIRSTSIGVSALSMSDRSHSDIKRKLEQRLADTKAKMYNIGRLGESLVQQEQELNDRIRELGTQSNDDEIKPELRSKLADLESGFKEVERESAKAFAKTIPFLGKVRFFIFYRY